MSDNKPTLRAQACRFRRFDYSLRDIGAAKNDYDLHHDRVKDWEPGIAFLSAFGITDVSVIVDAQGSIIARSDLYTYDLLQLRVDGYIAIEPGDYAGKRYSPKEDIASTYTERGDPAHDYR